MMSSHDSLYCFVNKDMRRREVRTQPTTPEHDHKEVICMAGILTDARRQAERELNEAKHNGADAKTIAILNSKFVAAKYLEDKAMGKAS